MLYYIVFYNYYMYNTLSIRKTCILRIDIDIHISLYFFYKLTTLFLIMSYI